MSDDIRFQADEHIPTAVIAGLQRRGIDALSTPKAGLLGATDKVQLALEFGSFDFGLDNHISLVMVSLRNQFDP
jgi:hypothetical protein